MLIDTQPLAAEATAVQPEQPSVLIECWDLQGVFGDFTAVLRSKSSLLTLSSSFAFLAKPAADHDPLACHCRTTYAVDTAHGLARRVLWAWSDRRGLQAVIKPAIRLLEDSETGALKLIPISEARHTALTRHTTD